MTYTVKYNTGVNWEADSKTLLGAKREANRNSVYGFGSITIEDSKGNIVAFRQEDEKNFYIPE